MSDEFAEQIRKLKIESLDLFNNLLKLQKHVLNNAQLLERTSTNNVELEKRVEKIEERLDANK